MRGGDRGQAFEGKRAACVGEERAHRGPEVNKRGLSVSIASEKYFPLGLLLATTTYSHSYHEAPTKHTCTLQARMSR